MATISSLSSSLFYCRIQKPTTNGPAPCILPSWTSRRSCPLLSLSQRRRRRTVAAVAEESMAPVEEDKEPVSVPVSPSDMLTMFFKAEGMMDEGSTSKVSKALEDVEGISDLKVQVSEGIATVELTKQTTVQATGVASNLVEVIQGSGFKLQSLCLSFEDEEDAVN